MGGIYLVRDPRDVLLSFSNHLNLSQEDVFKKMVQWITLELDENDPDLKEGYKRSCWDLGQIIIYLGNLIKVESCFFKKYEDLVKNPYESFNKVLTYLKKNFLSFELNNDKIRKINRDNLFRKSKKIEDNEGF